MYACVHTSLLVYTLCCLDLGYVCLLLLQLVYSIEQEEFVTMMMLEHVKEPERYALIQSLANMQSVNNIQLLHIVHDSVCHLINMQPALTAL
jgi:hypothetical protein